MKVSILGWNQLGCCIGYTLVLSSNLSQLALIDPQRRIPPGAALDLEVAGIGLKRSMEVIAGSELELAQDSDLVIWAMDSGSLNHSIPSASLDRVKLFLPKLLEFSPKSILLVASHPPELLVYLIWKLSGKPRSQILGTGATHGSIVLSHAIQARVGALRDGLMLGLTPGFPLKSYLDFPLHWAELVRELDHNLKMLAETGAILSRSICAGLVAKAILEDLKQELGVSAVLDGEYGLRDVVLGVPAILGSRGVELILEYELDQQELELMQSSADEFRRMSSKLGAY